MSTPISGLNAYCTPARFLQGYDWRTVGDLLNDYDQRPTYQSVVSSTILVQLLQEASGMLETACFVGNRYSTADIQAVINQGGNGASYVQGIVAGMTMWLLFDRRPELYQRYELPKKAEWASEVLDRLRLGERILPLQENANAGLPNSQVLTPALVFQQNLSTTEAFRFFGVRGNQMSPGTGGWPWGRCCC
jgi:hypothetical protein